MKLSIYALLLLLLTCCTSVAQQNRQAGDIVFETTKGTIVVRLYDDTPLHRDNFLKLVEAGTYNNVLFHRVIKDFMIQTGDPKSRNAEPGQALGTGDLGYTIDAEIVFPKHFHKKGALAAARQGDNTNPLKKSSSCQFYIVQGKVFSPQEVDALEQNINNKSINAIVTKYLAPYQDEILKYREAGDQENLQKLMEKIRAEAKPELDSFVPMVLPDELKTAYTTIGGAPHLDNAYTVFGEVVEGLAIVDLIGNSHTDNRDRPTTDVVVTKVEIVK